MNIFSEQTEKISGNIETEIFTSEDKGYQASKWFFTYHMQKGEQFEHAFKRLEELKKICDKYVWGEEYGEEGKTPHIQGAFILKGKMKMRRTTLIKNYFQNQPFMLKCKNFECALQYCLKEGNEIHTNIETVKPIKTINETELFSWQKNLISILKNEPDNRTIYWIEGKQGVGKTQFIKYCVVKLGAIILNGKPSDMKNGIIDYIKKEHKTPKIILSNIGFDKDLSRIHYSGYEDLKDMCFYSGKYEGGMVVGDNPHLIIFANGKPETNNKKFKHIKIKECCK